MKNQNSQINLEGITINDFNGSFKQQMWAYDIVTGFIKKCHLGYNSTQAASKIEAVIPKFKARTKFNSKKIIESRSEFKF